MGFLILLAVVLACDASYAETAPKPSDRLHQVEQQLSEKKHQQELLDQQARDTAKNLNDLRQRLIESTQALQDKENEQETLEDKLDDLTQQIAVKSKNAEAERKELAKMVSALVEIAGRPPESLFLQNHVTEDHIHRSLLLKAILPRLREEAENAARDLVALYDLQTQMAQQKRLVEASRKNLEKQQQDMDQMIATRQGFLQRTEQEKAEVASHLAALAEQAHDLRQLMEKIAPREKQPKAAEPKNAARVGGGNLKRPVAGTVRHSFGDKDADGVVSEGVTFAAPSGAPIVAPQAGRVVFAGPFRGYGLIMILQHGNGYHSFLSGFGRIDAEMGQDVAAGEPLGVLPVKAGGKPELYFEWRAGDDPVAPPLQNRS